MLESNGDPTLTGTSLHASVWPPRSDVPVLTDRLTELVSSALVAELSSAMSMRWIVPSPPLS